jgi:hypothetical protein
LIIIDVVNDGCVYVVHRLIVDELVAVPISAFISTAHIPKAVVDPAIEADVRTPIAVVPVIATAPEPPIGRSPKGTKIRGNNPHARHPIIARGRISPVTGSPKIIVARALGLAVLRDWWRRLFRVDGRLTIVGVVTCRVVLIVVLVTRRSGLGLV